MVWIWNDYENDWHRLMHDGEVIYEGHSIPGRAYVKLLRRLGIQVSNAEWDSQEPDAPVTEIRDDL